MSPSSSDNKRIKFNNEATKSPVIALNKETSVLASNIQIDFISSSQDEIYDRDVIIDTSNDPKL